MMDDIEINHGDEMKRIIIASYTNGTPARGNLISNFHERIKKSPRQCYSAWKSIEKKLFQDGLIAFIENPIST